jgi:hypothetical protein
VIRRPVIRFRAPEHIAAALTVGRDDFILASARDAQRAMGPALLRVIAAPALAWTDGPPVVIDCGDDGGGVMAALAAGWIWVSFDGARGLRVKLAQIAEQCGARLLTLDPARELVLHDDTDPAQACRVFLQQCNDESQRGIS